MNNPQLQWQTIVSEPFAENTYILTLGGSSGCILVDPGLEPEKFLDVIEAANLVPDMILNTHGHSDHIAGNAFCKDRWPDCPLVIGHRDAPMLADPILNLSAPFGVSLVSPMADRTVVEGDHIAVAGIRLEVFDTPGHSPGHVVFVWKGASPHIVVGGDVLFRGSIGRTDFPGGSFEQLAESIHKKLFTLPDDTVVLPGHGPATTVGEEKATNPFVGVDR